MDFTMETNCRTVHSQKTLWMAIVNATPDSFSDGGRSDLAEHALSLLEQGADILDIGGESTRPGAEPVPPEVEIRRITPVISEILRLCAERGREKPLMSVDTYHPETAEAALALGVEILNDISGMENPRMIRLAQTSNCGVCFMHMQGNPRTMQQNPRYTDVVEEVYAYLAHRRDALLSAGIRKSALIADPGLGFGKTHAQCLELVTRIARFHDLGLPLLVGHSRKGFLSQISQDRELATRMISEQLVKSGVQILRTHENLYCANGQNG